MSDTKPKKIVTKEIVADTFDEYNESYNDTVNNSVSFSGLDVDFFTRVKADYLVDIMEKHFGAADDLKVLDVGCGVGNFHPFLLSRVDELHGVDVSEKSIEKAKAANAGVQYICYDGMRLPYEDATFDVAYAICVMHHVPVENWQNFSNEIQRVLKPGGICVIFEHNPKNPVTMKVVNDCPFDEDAVLLKSPEVESYMQKAQFENVRSKYILTIPAANKFLRKVDGWFSKIPLGAQYYVVSEKA